MNMHKIRRRIDQAICAAGFYLLKLISPFFAKNYDYWLLSERGVDARDNGFVFYEYMKRMHPEIQVKYVISKDSPDYSKINSDDIIPFRSVRHYLAYINAPVLISTHYQGYSPNFELFSQLDRHGLIKVHGYKVFLQHGVNKDTVDWSRKNRRVQILVCGARQEYDFLLQTTDYGREILKYTGLPRFDKLFEKKADNIANQILVMPTWRMKFTNMPEKEFVHSDYYLNFQGLLNSQALHSYLEEKNVDLVFYPHIEMQKYIHLFECANKRIKIKDANTADVQELLLKSKILITDFSSVYFDFAFLLKPVIYFQFDKAEYREKHYQEGWFSYEESGFGPVCENIAGVIEALYQLDDEASQKKYYERMKKTFEIRDSNNCERVYQEICEIIKG